MIRSMLEFSIAAFLKYIFQHCLDQRFAPMAQ